MKNILLSFLFFMSAFSCTAWTRVAAPTGKDLLCVSFGSPSVGYIGGADSILIKTTDGGRTWVKISPAGMDFSAFSRDIVDISFINSSVGYAIISNRKTPEHKGLIYKTTDGGLSWVLMLPGSMACRKTFFFDEGNGFAVGSAFFSGKNVSKMTTGIWNDPRPLHYDSRNFLYAVDFYDKNTGITGGDSGDVYRTFNGGASWDTINTSVRERINDLKYLDENNIIAATGNNDFPLIVSNDKGRTWSPVSLGTFEYPEIKAIAPSSKDSVIIVGINRTSRSGLIQGMRDGISYNTMYGLNAIDMVNDSVAYAVGDSGLIMTNYMASTAIEPVVPEGFSLYPNPAKSTFYVSAQEECRIIVSDLTGRIVTEDRTFARVHNIHMGNAARGMYSILLVLHDGRNYSVPVVLE